MSIVSSQISSHYEELTNKYAEDIEEVISDDTKKIDEVIKNFDKIQDKIKYKAFGKTRIKKRVNRTLEITEGIDDGNNDARELLAKQSKKIEDEILSINKNCSGRVAKVFRMRDVVRGSRKGNQEAHAIVDTETKEVIVNQKIIKEKTLEYNLMNLKNNEPSENVKDLVRIQSELHDSRMEEISEENFEITEQDFEKVLKKFQRKNKRGYDFLVRAGKEFKKPVYRLCKRMIEDETFPERFEETTLQQISKI